MNDFNDDLAFSHRAANWPGWDDLYRRAFPSFQAMIDHRADGEHQRAGIDRSIVLQNAKQVLVDEKVRRKDYGDILLEVLSDEERGVDGWVKKQIRADYIAYLVAPSGNCYLLPVLQLQNAWARHGEQWQRLYGLRRAPNRKWITVNCPVPVADLYQAIGGCLRVKFEAFQ